jgi:sulfur carrier protein
MKIICNGKEREIQSGASLNDLIVELDLNPATVVAECNGVIVRREEYSEYQLNDGDKLELIRFVGGG